MGIFPMALRTVLLGIHMEQDWIKHYCVKGERAGLMPAIGQIDSLRPNWCTEGKQAEKSYYASLL